MGAYELGPGAPPRFWAHFWRGVTEPSLAGLILTVAVASGVVLGVFRGLTAEVFASRFGAYWWEDDWDDFAFLSQDVLRARGASPAPLQVAILGASGVQEALSGAEQVGRVIRRRAGLEPHVYNWTAKNLSILEMGAVAEQVIDGFNGVLVFGVGMRAVSYRSWFFENLMANPRLAFVSPLIDEEARLEGIAVPWRSGNYLWDNRQFFSSRLRILVSNLRHGPPRRRAHHFISPYQIAGARRAEVIANLDRIFGFYDRRVAGNLATFERIIDRLERRGIVSIAIVEAPVNPDYVEEWGGAELYARHREKMAGFAEARGLSYWSPATEARITSSEFFDWCHLRSQRAQRRFTRVLSLHIADLLEAHVARLARPAVPALAR